MLAIDVGAATRPRALHFFNALLKVLEQRGHKVESDTSPQRGRGTLVILNGEPLRVRLRERLNRVPHVMTKDERIRFERHGWEPYTKYDFHPSGDLQLEAARPEYSWVHKTWKDGKKRKLEQLTYARTIDRSTGPSPVGPARRYIRLRLRREPAACATPKSEPSHELPLV